MGEKFPEKAEKVNVDGFMNALNLAREYKCKMFSPSSIASYGGDHFPKDKTPEDTILQP
jgi:nucleoside-diphosphate-sugar epimerase